MCGIVGVIGPDAGNRLIRALYALEIRGYDSAGIAMWDGGISIRKGAGYVANVFRDASLLGDRGIGHVRWATHGAVDEINAHPLCDCSGTIAVCHNGVIENLDEIRMQLVDKHEFKSQTDSEIIGHLLEGKDLVEGVERVSTMLSGDNSFLVLSNGRIIGYCGGPPLSVASGEIASDAGALTKTEFLRLQKGDIVEITENGYLFHRGKAGKQFTFCWENESPVSRKFNTMFEKEIYEQPKAILGSLKGNEKELTWIVENIRDDIFLTGAGSSKVACLWAENMFRQSGAKVETIPSGEWDDKTMIQKHSLVFVVSQSGETGTNRSVVEHVRKYGGKIVAVVNTPWSSLAAMSDCCLNLNCGIEVSVIASKSFMSQCVILNLVASSLMGNNSLFKNNLKRVASALEAWLPCIDEAVGRIEIKQNRCFVCGARTWYPIAHEGAMKLKEGALVFAEPMMASELKHEALPLIQEGEIVIWVSDKSPSGIAQVSEIQARRGTVIGISTDDHGFDMHLKLPKEALLFPPIAVVPLQLLTLQIAQEKGINVDRPRNLAKTITVR